jgi:hypothetical protein
MNQKYLSSISGEGKRFFWSARRSDRLWGTTSLLNTGCRGSITRGSNYRFVSLYLVLSWRMHLISCVGTANSVVCICTNYHVTSDVQSCTLRFVCLSNQESLSEMYFRGGSTATNERIYSLQVILCWKSFRNSIFKFFLILLNKKWDHWMNFLKLCWNILLLKSYETGFGCSLLRLFLIFIDCILLCINHNCNIVIYPLDIFAAQ